MNTLVQFRKTTQLSTAGASPATSITDDYRQITDEIMPNEFLRAESIYAPVMRNLNDAFLDAIHDDWDAEGSPAVQETTYHRAKLFITKCLIYFPAPRIGADSNGEIGLEWHMSPKWCFYVSIGPEEAIAFAGLRGGHSFHGSDIFVDDIPRAVLENLQQTYNK